MKGIVAIAIATVIGGKVFLLAEQAAIGAPTLGAGKSLWVEVALQPDHANAGIEQLSYRKVNHIAMIPHRTLATHEPCSNCL